ncbi:MAG: hypothetical protein KDA42_10860 [Planctomycetales bacterium]|nr:hypothetical protein [Planctomycetales bacterium]
MRYFAAQFAPLLAAALVITTHDDAAAESPAPVQVFLLAGQSNMEGQGVVDLDHPDYYNGGRGTLVDVLAKTNRPEMFQHVRTNNGEWAVRDDVWCRFKNSHGTKQGRLSIGFAGYPGHHHIGPEFQFGHVVGQALAEPVLLVKTAWGGKSLFQDFRPPRSGGATGPYYTQMIAETREALERMAIDFPDLKGREYKSAGLVWFQGWNDAFGPETARAEYEQNLVNLILDIRDEFHSPHLPTVIGELGNGGENAGDRIQEIRRAQAAAAVRKELRGNVAFVKTTAFARPAEESPNTGHGHHWFGNAESYFLIGDALGRAMVDLLTPQ